jgi:hypothetical protein
MQHFREKKKLWYATPVSLLCKTYGAVSQCPMIPACTLIENQLRCHDCRIAWGFNLPTHEYYGNYNAV